MFFDLTYANLAGWVFNEHKQYVILMAAAAVSAVTNALSGESFTEVFIILVVVLLNAVLGVVQESRLPCPGTLSAPRCFPATGSRAENE